ncbi:hypothetical protein MASR1M97_08610 [Candidatus Desulfobacillus denitrificans]
MRSTSWHSVVHRAVRRAHQAVGVEGALDLGALGLDAAPRHRAGGAQLDVEALVLLLQAVQLGRRAHGEQQRLGLPGLEQVLVDAGLVDAGDDVLGLGVAGDDDAHRVGPAAARLLQRLHAGDAGHALVAEDDVDRLALEQGQRLLAAGGGEHLELLLQRAAQGLLRADLVVDHQDCR